MFDVINEHIPHLTFEPTSTYRCGTWYEPNQPRWEELETRLKSHVLAALRSEQASLDQGELQVWEHIRDEVQQLRIEHESAQSFAAFVVFDAAEVNRLDLSSLQIWTVSGEAAIEPYQYIGFTFDYRPAIKHDQWVEHVAVVDLAQQQARLFYFHGREWHELTAEDNPFTIQHQPRQYERMSIDKSRNIYHGTGSEVAQRQQESGNELFTKQLRDTVISTLKDHSIAVDRIIVVYSDRMKAGVAWLTDQFTEVLQVPATAFSSRLVKPSDLQKQVIAHLDQVGEQQLESMLHTAKEAYPQLAVGWKEVIDAARRGQIRQLYISPQAEHVGYINQALLYTYPVKNSKKVGNIAPWIVNQAADQAEEIVVSEQVEPVFSDEIAALTYY